MSATVDWALTIPMPQISKITAVRSLVLRVTWSAGVRIGRSDEVDLSPMINALKLYQPLRKDNVLFSTAHLIEDGRIIAWGDDDQIDMAADSVEQLAEEIMTPEDFRDFLHSNGLTHTEAAALLGRSRRQIENYLSGSERIPRVLVMACYGLKARRLRRGLADGFLQTKLQNLDTETIRSPDMPHSEPLLATATAALEEAA